MAAPTLALRLIPKPRALVLASDTHALVIRPSPAEDGAARPQVAVEFAPVDELDLAASPKLTRCYGLLGLLQLGNDIFVAVITQTSSVGSLFSNQETISRVHAVDFYCLTSSTFDSLSTTPLAPSGSSSSLAMDELDSAGYAVDDSMAAQRQALQSQGLYEHPAASIKKILGNGHFYFSSRFDISSHLEARVERGDAKGVATAYDPRFLWNSFLIDSLLGFREELPPPVRRAFDEQAFLVLAIQGYAGVFDLSLSPPPGTDAGPTRVTISLISRLGWKRAGTRFITRGVDDDGHVANFVETETVISASPLSAADTSQPSLIGSYVQIRGSVPLFFEQSGTGVQTVLGGLSGQGVRVTITRSGAASLPAFEKHFEDVVEDYGSVQVLNLLGSKEGETALSNAYAESLRSAGGDVRARVGMTAFDFHGRSKGGAGLEGIRNQLLRERSVRSQLEAFGFCLVNVGEKDELGVVTKQQGVFRTNCLDCLDRTNVVQDMLSQAALEHLLGNALPHAVHAEQIWNIHRTLWADNGDALSKIYAGTGALNTSFTRGGKQTFGGIISNATKSAARMYNSNFTDKNKQAAIDALLGNLANQEPVEVFNPVNEAVRSIMQDRKADYSSSRPISIWVGTYNVNGRSVGRDEILRWICPTPGLEPDIMVVAFQEMVTLSPQQVMTTDPEQRRRWESIILQALDARPEKKADYIILRSDQLVGAALIILIKSNLVHDVRNVEGTTKKTGLRGMAGNKGAVAIRLDFADSSFCFVTAHFAAGSSNVDERNSDYWTIADGLRFLKGKTIDTHENVIWAGDFNYRVSLPNEQVRESLARDDISQPLQMDQLSTSRSAQSVFPGYHEGPITFPPTYKYDLGSDRYDTSEKMRVPSWTDRVLYRGADLDLVRYDRAEIRSSDHKPVFAVLRAKVRVIDRVLEKSIRAEALEQAAKADVGDEPLDLPPPSDDQQAWWNGPDNASVTVSPSTALLASVSGLTTNPFEPTFFKESAPHRRRTPPPPPSAKTIPPSSSAPSSDSPGKPPPPVPPKPKS